MYHVPTSSQPSDNSLARHMGGTALTCAAAARRPAAQWLHLDTMKLLERDYRILRLVAQFGQLTTSQIRALVFHENRSDSPCEIALRRLVKAGLVEIVEQSHPGGRRGGRSVNVFQLGKEGWPIFFEGRRRFSRVINAHKLAIGDTFVALKSAEREGWLSVVAYSTEPDSHVTVSGAELRPDLYVEVGLVEQRRRIGLWLEIDLGTERQKQIIDKIDRYVYAEAHSDDYNNDLFPESVVFLGVDDERVSDLKRMVARAKGVPEGLIRVEHISKFPSMLK